MSGFRIQSIEVGRHAAPIHVFSFFSPERMKKSVATQSRFLNVGCRIPLVNCFKSWFCTYRWRTTGVLSVSHGQVESTRANDEYALAFSIAKNVFSFVLLDIINHDIAMRSTWDQRRIETV